MKIKTLASRNYRLQRNVLFVIGAVLLSSNLFLSYRLSTEDRTVVLVPSLDREYVVGTNFVSEEYLKVRAQEFIFTLFSMHKDNVDSVASALLKQVDSSGIDLFKNQFSNLANDVSEKGYHHVFQDVVKYGVNTKTNEVLISGYLETYYVEQRVSREYKTYRVGFSNRGGVVMVINFSEVIND